MNTSDLKNSDLIYIPLMGHHTGIKYVRNLSSDSNNPMPCFRCYLVNTLYCDGCFDCVRKKSDITYCSWEQFRINANWQHYPGCTWPSTKKEYDQLQGVTSHTYSYITFDEYIENLNNQRVRFSGIPSDKDRSVRLKRIRSLTVYSPGWDVNEISLIPIPLNFNPLNSISKKKQKGYFKKILKHLW